MKIFNILSNFEALGTIWYIYISQNSLDYNFFNSLKQNVIIIIEDFEKKYSRFIEGSDISILNKQKTLNNPNCEFVNILELCQKYNKTTNNFFNIAVGGELEKLGYKKSFSHTKIGNREVLPMLDCILDISKNKIILNNNYNLDLGGIGKSYLVDKIKSFLLNQKIENFFINAGGDIYSNFEQTIYLQNPISTNNYLKKFKVNKKGVATSTPFLRIWKIRDKKHHHLVNPNKLDTILKYLSCTVVCDNIIDSDIWAKVILLSNTNTDIKIKDPVIYLVDKNLKIITLT